MAMKGGAAAAAQAFDQVVEFLESFEPLEDHRQRAKVLYPLDEVLLLVLLGVLAAARAGSRSRSSTRPSSICCDGFAPTRTARRRTTSLATFSQRSTPSSSRA